MFLPVSNLQLPHLRKLNCDNSGQVENTSFILKFVSFDRTFAEKLIITGFVVLESWLDGPTAKI